jgi:hypothetical protein
MSKDLPINSVIKLTGKGPFKTRAISLPTEIHAFSTFRDNPAGLVEILQSVDGDVEHYCEQFKASTHVSGLNILTRSLILLRQPGNEEHLAKFEALIAAWKHAKVMLAEHKAMAYIADFQLPSKGDISKGDISAYSQFSRLWLTHHLQAEVQRRKAKGKAAGIETTDPYASLLEGLKDEQASAD